ncbi:MAG: GNAT family protein [Microbacterium sp.]|uniref:GNAT family N-acetyltransferase n=1 Tax=Microbacterium sp. TaxID=51671 RepID=UPI0039E2B241
MPDPTGAGVRLRPWRADDLPLLVAANSPEMTAYLGGPESEDAVRARHEKYLRFVARPDAGIAAVELDGVAVGGVNWWSSEWEGAPVTEMGWFVVPAVQGRRIASTAVRLAVADAGDRAVHRRVVAFPAVENAPSNRVCAAAGFVRRGEADLPYRDTVLHAAVWELDLDASI